MHSTFVASELSNNIHRVCGYSRTFKEQEVENFCLENLWAQCMCAQSWSSVATAKLKASYADSTWNTCNHVIQKFIVFLQHQGFTLWEYPDSVLADFLCVCAAESE